MIIETITVTAFQQQTRILGCEQTRRAICVDPGDDAERIAGALRRHNLDLQAIALTHAHMDHVGGVAALKSLCPGAEIILHAADEPLYRQLPEQPAWIGIPRGQWGALGFNYAAPPAVERYWTDGESYEVGALAFRVLHCPGHTPGHVVLFEARERKVFVGDCLFAGSIGRTDLPGGSYEALMDSLLNKIIPLGDDVTVYSGHGPDTTIERERLTNPFLTGVYTPGRHF
ncbi:MAG TPA: MBL fold metallo-hydrolase [Pyrinomonadaceae bacterium]|jgi:glyoxylase-like metal-dependent hydrolase (beta-lactamase superfamily II)|nr:MBL fold metallo-hydrolase [Pyrinomonadaceae bacterium]